MHASRPVCTHIASSLSRPMARQSMYCLENTCDKVQAICIHCADAHCSASFAGRLIVLGGQVHMRPHQLPDIDCTSTRLNVHIACHQALPVQASSCRV